VVTSQSYRDERWTMNYSTIAGFIIFMLSHHAHAQKTLTLEQFMAQAFLQNLGLKIEKQQYEVDKANESANLKKLLPAFSFTSSGSKKLQDTTDSSLEVSSYTSGLSVEQALYKPSLWASWNKSVLNLQKADHGLKREAKSLIFTVKSSWYNLLTEQVLNQEAIDALLRLKQHKKNALAFYETGKIWRNDLLQAQVRVSRGEQDAFAANNRLKLAQSKVNQILNRDLEYIFETKGALKITTFKDDLSYYSKHAVKNRLDLQQSKIDIALANKDRDLANAKRKPTINFKVNTGVTATDFAYQESATQTVASLNLSWNFWQWGQTNQEVNAADAKIKVQQLSFSQHRAQIISEVQTTFLIVKEAQFSLKVSEQALQHSIENYRVSEIRYKEQLGSSSDVLDAQDLLTQTKKDRVLALSRYLTSVAQLKYVSGE